MERSWDSVTVTITTRTRNVLVLADEVASRHGQGSIGTEHLLLALIEEGNGVAAQVLHEMGAAEAARARTEDILRSDGYNSSSRANSPGTAIVTPAPLRLTIPPEQVLRLR